jgi:hypothetical protein
LIGTGPNCSSRFSPRGRRPTASRSPQTSRFGWTKTFTEPRLRAAIVDRLTYGGNIIETGIESYRLAQTRAQADASAVANKAAG